MKFSIKKKLLFAGVFLAGLVGAYAQTGYVFKIGYGIQATLCSAPLFIAAEKGFFQEEGLNYEEVKIDISQIPAMLTTGQIDATNHLLAMMIQPIANGLDAKIPLASPTLITQRYLAKRGISTTPPKLEVEWFVYPTPELGLALERGQVDAIALSDPVAQIVQNSGKGRAIINTGVDAELKDEFCCALVASGAVAKAHPEELAKFTRAVQKASKFVQENPDETARLIAEKKYVPGDPKVNADLLRGYNYRASVSEAKVAIERNAKDLQGIGLVNKNVNIARLTNSVFLPLKGVPDSLYK